MKYDYEEQAIAINTVALGLGHQNSDLGKALREAEVTLRALALIGEATILRAQKMEAVAHEIINMVFENRGSIYDDEAVELKEKLQKILGEWEPGEPDMNGPNQAERDEMHYRENQNL